MVAPLVVAALEAGALSSLIGAGIRHFVFGKPLPKIEFKPITPQDIKPYDLPLVLNPVTAPTVLLTKSVKVENIQGSALDPADVATDFAFGAVAGPVASKVYDILGPYATTAARTALVAGTSAATGVGVADLAEDYIRPAMYQATGRETKEAYPVPEFKNGRIEWKQPEGTVLPHPHPEELLVSVPLAFILGAGIGYAATKYYEGELYVPKVGKVSPDQEHTWVGIYKQAGYKAEPVVGLDIQGTKTVKLPLVNKEVKVPNVRLVKGNPNWERIDISKFPKWSEAGGYAPTSPIERELVRPALEKTLPAKEAEKLKMLDVVEKTYTLNLNPPDEKAFWEAIRQSRLAKYEPELRQFLTKYRRFGVIQAKAYGSNVQKAYMGSAMTRSPNDLDIQVYLPYKAEDAAKEAVKLFSKKGIVRVNPQSPGLVEEYIPGKGWVHLLDIHDMGEVPSLFGYNYISWGYPPKPAKYIQMKEGKLPVMPIEEQGARKVASSLQVWKEGKVAPVPHRTKDIIDAYEVQKYLVQKLPETERKALMPIVEKWPKLWSDFLDPRAFVEGARQLAAIYVSSMPLPYPLFINPFISGFISGTASQASETAKSTPSPTPSEETSKPSEDTSQPAPSSPSAPSSPPPSSPPPSAPSTSVSLSPPPSPSLPSASLSSPSPSVSPSPVYYSVSISPSPSFYAPPSVPVFGRIYAPAPAPPPGGPKAHANLPTKWVWEI